MADIPDGASLDVARVAIAWEMVKASNEFRVEHESVPTLDALVTLFQKAYKGVREAMDDNWVMSMGSSE